MSKLATISKDRQELNKQKLIESADVELYEILMRAEYKFFRKKHNEIIAEILNGNDKWWER